MPYQHSVNAISAFAAIYYVFKLMLQKRKQLIEKCKTFVRMLPKFKRTKYEEAL